MAPTNRTHSAYHPDSPTKVPAWKFSCINTLNPSAVVSSEFPQNLMELKAKILFRMLWVIAMIQGKIGGLLIDPAYLWNCNFSSKSCAENNSSFTNHSSHRAVFGHKEIECHSILARHAGVNNMLRLGFLPVLNFWNEWNNFKQIFHEWVKYCSTSKTADIFLDDVAYYHSYPSNPKA